MKNPTAYILVGVPGSGKSTWTRNQGFNWETTIVASTDDYIEQQARKQKKQYHDIFEIEMPRAIAHMLENVGDAFEHDYDLIWDQTSTTMLSRAKKLRMLPVNYRKVAVVFKTPERSEHQRRLQSRADKVIPEHVIANMINNLEEPTLDEGFDQIIIVGG